MKWKASGTIAQSEATEGQVAVFVEESAAPLCPPSSACLTSLSIYPSTLRAKNSHAHQSTSVTTSVKLGISRAMLSIAVVEHSNINTLRQTTKPRHKTMKGRDCLA
eukprot:498391-Amphidinium_carterae.1